MPPTRLPLVRTHYLLRHIDAYERMGGAPDRLLRNHGLEVAASLPPRALIPLEPFNDFVRSVVRDTNETLWRYSSPDQLEDLGAVGAVIGRSVSLYEAICSTCRLAKNESARSDFFTERRPGVLWWCRGRRGIEDELLGAHIERFLLQTMLLIVRHWKGPHWLPRELWLMSEPGPEDEVFRTVPRLRYCARFLAFPIPHRDLAAPVLPPPGPAPGPPMLELDLDSLDFVEALEHLIDGMLSLGPPRLEETSRLLGTSGRSLQRRLSASSTTYFEVVTRIRQRLAVQELLETSVTVTALAQRLGYSDSAHFARAFRRWFGVGPLEFRRFGRAG